MHNEKSKILEKFNMDLYNSVLHDRLISIHLHSDECVIRNSVHLTEAHAYADYIYLESDHFEVTIDHIQNIEYEELEYHSYIITLNIGELHIDLLEENEMENDMEDEMENKMEEIEGL